MAVYVTGDTHGADRLGHLSVDGFMNRLCSTSFPEQKAMSKEDYVLILGDFGGVWDINRKKCQESPREKEALDWLEARPFTTLFVPGNHENYDRLTGCRDERLLSSWLYASMPEHEKEKLRHGYPCLPFQGGMVRAVRPSVLMLERGDIFTLSGKSFFAFGGARSHDISGGVLYPPDYPDEAALQQAFRQHPRGTVRIQGCSFWEQEMPDKDEMVRGKERLKQYLESHEKIDFIVTHDAPSSDKALLGMIDRNELSVYLDEIAYMAPHGMWLYGHLHNNRKVLPNHILLYEQILRIV